MRARDKKKPATKYPPKRTAEISPTGVTLHVFTVPDTQPAPTLDEVLTEYLK